MNALFTRDLARMRALLLTLPLVWILSLVWPAMISDAAAGDETTPISLADRTARPELYHAAQELLWPWRETHFNCVTSTTLKVVGADTDLQLQIQGGATERYESKLTAIIERAYGRCQVYLNEAVSRIDEWNTVVAAHPITGEYRRLLLESYVSGAFLGVKSSLVYFSEAPEDYNIRTVEQLHADMVATLSDPERQLSVADQIGDYVEIVRRSHNRFMQIAPPG